MKVLFINPAQKNNARNCGIPLGIIAVASYLKREGHEIKIADRTLSNVNVIKIAEDFRPDIIGVSVLGAKSAPDAQKLSLKLRKLNYTVAWGGPFPACCPELILNTGLADYVFTGEGELAWAELLEALEGRNSRTLESVDGVYCKIGDKIHYNGMHELGDLSTFPIMDFELVNPSDYFQETFGCKKMLHICSAKGCPNHCTFCYNPCFNLSVYRKRPLEQVFAEITLLHDKYGMDGIYFTDECWANTREELHEFCNEFIKRDMGIAWGCQTTAGRFTKEDYELMYKAGCRWLFFGLESGSDKMLKNAGKVLDRQAVIDSVNYCHDLGIVSICAFIVGFPEETEDDIRETVKLADSIPASYYNVNFYYPLPGSPMCNKIEKNGRYKMPETVIEEFKRRGVETVQKGICDIKHLDLNVVMNYYMWKSLTGTGLVKINPASAFRFFIKVVREALQSMLNHGIGTFFSQLFYDAKQVLSIMFYGFCFPTIKKKYGIGKNKKKR